MPHRKNYKAAKRLLMLMAVGKKRKARRKHVQKNKVSADTSKVDNSLSFLRTDIDRLYDLVQKEGALNFKALTKELGLPQEQIELYAQILEKHHLVKVVYPYFGSPKVVKA